MTKGERALFVRCFGVLEWICGEGMSPVEAKYPDPDDLFMDLVKLLGQEEYDSLLAEQPNVQGCWMIPSPEEIEAAKTPRGGWTKATLAGWGIAWPPLKGWRQGLIREWLRTADELAVKAFLEKEYRDAV